MKVHYNLTPSLALASLLTVMKSHQQIGVHGHGLTIFVSKCESEVYASCCDLSKAPDSESVSHKEPDFGRSIYPNEAFSSERSQQIYVADLGVPHRSSVWDATLPECVDEEANWQPPSACWRYEPDGSDFPAFTPTRCSKDDSFNLFSVNIEKPLKYWDGKTFVATKNGERLKVYGQDWPEPSNLEEPKNEMGAQKWAAVLGASIITPPSSNGDTSTVFGVDVGEKQIEWVAAGNATGKDSPYTFSSSFAKDLSWGEDENWVDTTAGLKWNDHEHYLYQLVDSNGELCKKGTNTPPSIGSEIGSDAGETDDCANGVYYLVMSVTVDSVTSPPIEVLFARGVDMTGPAMQGAYENLQKKNKEAAAINYDNNNKSSSSMAQEKATIDDPMLLAGNSVAAETNNNNALSVVAVVVACVSAILAIYAVSKTNKKTELLHQATPEHNPEAA